VYKSREESYIKDPMEDMFDLANVLQRRTKQIGIILAYAFIAGLILGVFGVVGGLMYLYMGIFDGLFFLIGGIISFIIAYLADKNNDFIAHARKRLDTFSKLRYWTPTPRIPEGSDPETRFLSYLSQTDDRFSYVQQRHPNLIQRDTKIKGKTDRDYPFNIYLLYKKFISIRQYQLFVRIIRRKIRKEDVMIMKRDVESILQKNKQPPSRIVLLQVGVNYLEDEVIEYAEDNWILFPPAVPKGKEEHACPVEIITETSDGNYFLGIMFLP